MGKATSPMRFGRRIQAHVLAAFFLVISCLAAVGPCHGDVRGVDDLAGRCGPMIASDTGPEQLPPARSDNTSSSASAAFAWAAPGARLELIPPPAEDTPFVMSRDVPRAGFPPGVERPPKSSF